MSEENEPIEENVPPIVENEEPKEGEQNPTIPEPDIPG